MKKVKASKTKKPERVELRVAVDVPETWTKQDVIRMVRDVLSDPAFGKIKVQFV